MKPSSMQLHVSPPQNALSCTAYSLHFSRLSHSAASSSFCWMYRVAVLVLGEGAKQGMHLWPVLYDCPCTYSFLHDFASICRNAPFYQIAISSRFSPSEQSPGSYQHPLPWQILQPGSPGQCKLHDFTANEPGKMPTISKQCSFCDHLESPCLGAWSTSSSGTSLICLRTCRDEVRGAIRNLWKPLGFWNQFRSLFCPFWENTVAPGWAVHSRCHRLQELQLVPPVWTEGWQVVAGPAGSPWQMIAGVPDRTRQSRAFTDFHFLDWLNLVYPVFHF